jgi:hypothetical protein
MRGEVRGMTACSGTTVPRLGTHATSGRAAAAGGRITTHDTLGWSLKCLLGSTTHRRQHTVKRRSTCGRRPVNAARMTGGGSVAVATQTHHALVRGELLCNLKATRGIHVGGNDGHAGPFPLISKQVRPRQIDFSAAFNGRALGPNCQ